jgi:hypothetical protein
MTRQNDEIKMSGLKTSAIKPDKMKTPAALSSCKRDNKEKSINKSISKSSTSKIEDGLERVNAQLCKAKITMRATNATKHDQTAADVTHVQNDQTETTLLSNKNKRKRVKKASASKSSKGGCTTRQRSKRNKTENKTGRQRHPVLSENFSYKSRQFENFGSFNAV